MIQTIYAFCTSLRCSVSKSIKIKGAVYLVGAERDVADGRKVDFPFDYLEELALMRPLFRLLSSDEVDELWRQNQVPLARLEMTTAITAITFQTATEKTDGTKNCVTFYAACQDLSCCQNPARQQDLQIGPQDALGNIHITNNVAVASNA